MPTKVYPYGELYETDTSPPHSGQLDTFTAAIATAAKRESTIMALRMSGRCFFMGLSPFGVIVVNVAASPYRSKTLTAQWNQPPWCWSVLRVRIVPIRERATGLRLILKLNWLRWFFVGFMLSYNAKLCQAYFAQNRQFLAIEIFERRILSKRLCGDDFT